MKDVLAVINAKVEELVEKNIFYKFLSDESIPTTERISRIAPCLAYFVMGFCDLQNLILKYPASEAKLDSIKKAINDHCAEDSTHWPWFLADLKLLGLDKEMTYTSAIKNLWGKENRSQRETIYQFAILADRASDPILRFVFLMAMERNGQAAFMKMLDVADKIESETGKELLYFGRTHLAKEIGSLHGGDEIENELLTLELSTEMKTKAMEIGLKLLQIQEAQFNELGKVAYANKNW